MTVRRVGRSCERSTTDTVPIEESKRLQTCIPPLERVIFTVALEVGRVCMDRRDAIIRDDINDKKEVLESKNMTYLEIQKIPGVGYSLMKKMDQ